jgi:hypothetical protein
MSGDWFLTAKGRRLAQAAAITALFVVPAWVAVDDRVIGADGWLPGSANVVSNGLIPFVVLLAGTTAFYLVVRRMFNASRNEAVQSLFVLFFVAFAVLTATAAWFRGPGMTLVLPWQI